MAQVQFHFADAKITLKDRVRLKAFLNEMFETEQVPLDSLTYIFCSDQYLIEINRQFLNHDDYTDIITFNLADKDQPIIGEIYISVDRVKENALIHKVSTNEELHRVIYHGVLHLCGYRDKNPKDIARMRQAEATSLKLYSIVPRETKTW